PTAQKRVDQALAKRPRDAAYLQLASRVSAAQGDARTAESTLRRALALDGTNVGAALLLAQGLSAQGRQAEATEVLDHLLERQPSSIAAQTSRAMLLEHMGRGDDARAA